MFNYQHHADTQSFGVDVGDIVADNFNGLLIDFKRSPSGIECCE